MAVTPGVPSSFITYLDNDIPSRRFFQFLQFRHAPSAQAKRITLRQINTPLMNQLVTATDKKGYISTLYRSLFIFTWVTVSRQERWATDIAALSGEIWQTVLEQVLLVSPIHQHNLGTNSLLYIGHIDTIDSQVHK